MPKKSQTIRPGYCQDCIIKTFTNQYLRQSIPSPINTFANQYLRQSIPSPINTFTNIKISRKTGGYSPQSELADVFID